jgi:hypothetical protein
MGYLTNRKKPKFLRIKSYRLELYNRIISILRDGMGDGKIHKRFYVMDKNRLFIKRVKRKYEKGYKIG